MPKCSVIVMLAISMSCTFAILVINEESSNIFSNHEIIFYICSLLNIATGY